MLENKDRIAQPARGRFFPVTVAEIIKVLRDLGFAPPTYRKRVDIIFRNLDTTGHYGRIVAAFYPADEMIIYSVFEDLDRQRAKTMLDLALREFSEIGKGAKPTDRRPCLCPIGPIMHLRVISSSLGEFGEPHR